MVFIRSSELTHFKIYPLTNIYFPLLRPLTITILLFHSPEPWLWTAFLLHSSWLSLLDELRERCNLNSWRNQALTPMLSLSLVRGSEAEQGLLAAELGCPGGGVIRLNESIVFNLFRMYSLRLFFFFTLTVLKNCVLHYPVDNVVHSEKSHEWDSKSRPWIVDVCIQKNIKLA